MSENHYEKRVDHHEQELSRLNQVLTQLAINISTMTEKQNHFIDKLDSYVSRDEKREERIANLENAIRDDKHFKNSLIKLSPFFIIIAILIYIAGASSGDTQFLKNLISFFRH